MNAAEMLTGYTATKRERERHRLAYAYWLSVLTDAVRGDGDQPGAETLIAARKCREERALALRMTEPETDRRLGTVLDVARWITSGEDARILTAEDAAEVLGAEIEEE